MKKYLFLLFLVVIQGGLFLSATMSAELCDSAIRLRRIYKDCPGVDYKNAVATIKNLQATLELMPDGAFVDTDQLGERIIELLNAGFFITPIQRLSHSPTSLESFYMRKRNTFFQTKTDEYLSRLTFSFGSNASLRDFIFSTIAEIVLRELQERHIFPPLLPARLPVQERYPPESDDLSASVSTREEECPTPDRASTAKASSGGAYYGETSSTW